MHGHVAPFAEVKLAPPKVANVWVRYGEQRWNEKNLSLYITLKELRGKTQSLSNKMGRFCEISQVSNFLRTCCGVIEKFSFTVGLAASKLRIWHNDQCQPMLMRFPTKRLYSYNVKDGDEFLIDEKL